MYNMNRYLYIDCMENIILNSEEFNMIPQYLKNKFTWHKELDCNESYYVYRKGDEEQYCPFKYVEMNDFYNLSSNEYEIMPQYLKEKYIWMPSVYRYSDIEWITFNKISYNFNYTIILSEIEYNNLSYDIKINNSWMKHDKYYINNNINLNFSNLKI